MPINDAAAVAKSRITRPYGERGQGRKPRARPLDVEGKELVRQQRAPINVMLRTMWYWDELAESIGAQIYDRTAELETANTEQKFEILKELNMHLAQFFNARDKAYEAAEGAAPYFHARLSHMKVDGQLNVSPAK